MAECPLCHQRKGRRACPAKAATICPHCCGTKRRVEIDCPEHCAYLSGAHAQGWEGRETERRRDARLLAPRLQALDSTQAELLVLALGGITAIWHRRRDLDDQLLGQAVAALRKTVETRTRGILYEHAADALRAEDFVRELRGLFESTGGPGVAKAPADRDLLPVLRALESMLEERAGEGSGATAFLEAAARLAGRIAPPSRPAPGPLIVEP